MPRRRPRPPDRPAPEPGEGGDPDVRADRERYQALVEYAPDAIVILDLDAGHFVTVNAAAEELFGMRRDELLRVGPVEVSPPEQPDGRPSREAAMAYLGRALVGQRPRFEWTHCRADGTPVPCEITLLRLPDPDRRLVRGSILDITARREGDAARAAAVAEQTARRAAEASLARLRATVSGLNAIVWERDPVTLRLTFVNERAEELLGYPASRWLVEDGLWERIVHPDDRERARPGPGRDRRRRRRLQPDLPGTGGRRTVGVAAAPRPHLPGRGGLSADAARGALRRHRGPPPGAGGRSAGRRRSGAHRPGRPRTAAGRGDRAARRRAG